MAIYIEKPYNEQELASFIKQNNPNLNKIVKETDTKCYLLEPYEYIE